MSTDRLDAFRESILAEQKLVLKSASADGVTKRAFKQSIARAIARDADPSETLQELSVRINQGMIKIDKMWEEVANAET